MNIVKDNKNKKRGLAILTLLFAIILFTVVTPIGVVFNVLYSFYRRNIKGFFNYWKSIFYQVWIVSYNLIFFVAISIDYFGNAFCGELIKLFVTKNKHTLFGRGEVTLSAAIGQAEFAESLTPFGIWLSKSLDVAFNEEGHCLIAYTKWFNENNI